MDWIRGNTVGRGSSATVSVATSCRSGNIFAAKSVEFFESEMLQREQKLLSTLNSPQIVQYIGDSITMEDNKLMYNLMMEYAPAGTLYDAIRNQRGRLEESVIGQYTYQIVQGLEYLHSSGVVHCDIKGQNILITESGAKIADFGCAKWSDPDASASMPIAGTPMFMAPEVARGEEQGSAADIWALGCTIIEMATGMSPWPNVNSDPLSVLYKIAYSGELPNIPVFLSTEAKDFLSKCLQKDPKSRWTAKQLINHSFVEEFNLSQRQNQKSFTSSPTSILDHRAWTSTEESETMDDIFETKSASLAHRIGGLWLNSRAPNWKWEETWITIRENVEGVKQDNNVGGR
ncbi:Protein kinase domain-containing protein [Heracleum sosnowskyi]|uniref:mitogen-activated protein kinase kinase kinase n=1 Tax=Heracleum sosnowskyi TaxID=360622 RepID=A0AAD8JJ73_9APIA|nr:Protein kinase domain-containing protein [Heracleum sosnowskyi]